MPDLDPSMFDGLSGDDGYEGDGAGASSPEPASWAGPTQEEWQQNIAFQQNVLPFLGAVEQRLFQQQSQQQPQDQGPWLPDFDPFDPASVQAHIQASAQALIDQRMGPIEPVLNYMADQASEQIANQHLDMLANGDPSRGIQGLGQFDREMAVIVASGMIDPSNPQFDAPSALRQAAVRVQQYESKIRADERAKQENTLRTLGEAPRTGAFGGGAGENAPVPPNVRGIGVEKYDLAIRNAMARPAIPTG